MKIRVAVTVVKDVTWVTELMVVLVESQGVSSDAAAERKKTTPGWPRVN